MRSTLVDELGLWDAEVTLLLRKARPVTLKKPMDIDAKPREESSPSEKAENHLDYSPWPIDHSPRLRKGQKK